MVLYDSSVLIDYLDGVDAAVNYAETHADERAVTVPLVLFEIYQGEVYKSGAADFDAVDDALDWLMIADESAGFARDSAELLAFVASRGSPLAARDAYIAGAAASLDERLVASDTDFDTDVLREKLPVDLL
jgi:hypothetical protein